eukprot:COSAG02_NODE_35503_length_467_cov_0.913043_1_plen_42_part_10
MHRSVSARKARRSGPTLRATQRSGITLIDYSLARERHNVLQL